MREIFKAPWSLPLKLITSLAVLAPICSVPFISPATVLIILLILGFCGAFYIVGYRVTTHRLYINYLWRSKIWKLNDLLEAKVAPNAMARSIRILGTGLFSSVGFFYNSHLGWFHAYATNPKLSVVLKFDGNRTIVVTPDDPENFLDAINEVQKLGKC